MRRQALQTEISYIERAACLTRGPKMRRIINVHFLFEKFGETTMRPLDTRPRRPVLNFRMGAAAALLLGLGLIAACQTQQEAVSQREDNLAAAGFVVRPANTPARQAMLKRLPPHKFVQRGNGDHVHYVYADPLVCSCLYVGSQQAYNQFKRDQQQKQLADEQQMTAQMYSDSAWNWGAWGPWGAEYGFGVGDDMGW